MHTCLRQMMICLLALFLIIPLVVADADDPAPLAATLTVTTSDPAVAADGQCSLIEAIINANNDDQSGSVDCGTGSGPDVLDLSQITVSLTTFYANYSGQTGLPQIVSPMTLQNGGLHRSSTDTFRFLSVASIGDLTLLNMVLENGGGPPDSYNSSRAAAVLNEGTVQIINSEFYSHQARSEYVIRNLGTMTITDSEFTGNNVFTGRVFSNIGGTLTIRGTLIADNEAFYSLSNTQGTVIIDSSTITGKAKIDNSSGNITIRNSIIWGVSDTITISDGPHALPVAGVVAEYSIIKGGYPGTGNLSADPRFVNPQSERDLPSLNGDYRLTELSAVIDAGSNTLAAGAGISSTDLDGNPRYADNTGVGDKGEGTAPLIDPGAYEFQGTTTACTGYTYPYTVTSGTGDLTRAIECANLNSTADTIDLNSTTYDISTGYAYTWNIDGLPPLATDITLRNGTLNAGNSRRGLNVGVNTRVQLDTLTIQSGRSTWGGGIYNYGDLTVSNTRLENNIPVLGTVYNRANMLIEKSYVLGNDAFTGGGIFNRAALQVRESVIAGNVAQYGAALHTTDTGTTTITNSTIASNDIQAVGTARGAVIEGFTTVENSIIWNHQRGDIVFSDTPTVSYSIVPFEIDGGFNNLVANPNFMNPVDPVTAPSSSGDYRIQALSPAVDAGSNTLAASAGIGTADIAGNPRYADDTSVANSGEGTSPLIDIGPHESQATACSAYMYPYTVTTENELIGALHCASAKGVSADVIDLNGTTITLTGAYSDAYNRRALPTVYNPVTVQNGTLDGSSITDGFFYVSETGGNLTLDNMTLQNGGAADIYYGGVIDNRAILTIRNSTFSGNQARQGGAIYSSLDATVTNTLFENNHATSTQTGSGGAIYSGAPDANLYVADSTFNGNSAVTLWGSAIYSNSGTAGLTVERSLFSGNTGGTTLYNHFGSMTINDSEFINNSTPFGGGAIVYKEPLAASEINRTLFDSNTAAYAGGAVLNNDGGSSDMLLLTINDSVFINNSASIGSAIYNAGWRGSDFKRYRGFLHVSTSRFDNNQGSAIANSDGSLTIQNSLIANHNRGVYQTSDGGTTTLINTTLSNSPVERDSGGLSIYNSILWGTDALIIGFGTVEYSIVEGGYTGTGNLNVNPQFVEQQTTPGGDYQLADGSPAIDAASNSYGAGSLDLAGNPRYDDDPTTPDTGAGNSPIIDMGAYELQYLPTGTDVNGDGIISPTDAMYVINRLGSGDLSADVDGDGTVDLDDVTVIQNELGNPAP